MGTLSDAGEQPAGNHQDPASDGVVIVPQSRARRGARSHRSVDQRGPHRRRRDLRSHRDRHRGRPGQAILRPAHLDVSARLIHYAGASGGKRPDLVKDDGQEVRVYWRRSGRTSYLVIEQPATGLRWSIPYFSRRAVSGACRARGWRTDPPKSQFRG